MAEDTLYLRVHRRAKDFVVEATGLAPTDRHLFRMGLIGPEEYDALFRLEYQLRWWTSGKYPKRRLSKARRRAWKTGRPCSLPWWESECSWKGT